MLRNAAFAFSMALAALSLRLRSQDLPQRVSILSPTSGADETGDYLTVSISLSPIFDDSTLNVILDGRDISERFRRAGICESWGCPESATIAAAELSSIGAHTLVAGVVEN